jgi:ribosomal protein S18 acetylase RimI-like enzyme
MSTPRAHKKPGVIFWGDECSVHITVEEAALTDSAAIGDLVRQELGYPEISDDGIAARMHQMAADEHYATFVAKDGGSVVGFIGLHQGIAFEVDGALIRITALAVKSGCQRSGIGSQLLQAAEEYAAQRDIRLVALNSGLARHGAHAFYESKGYHKKGYSFRKSI